MEMHYYYLLKNQSGVWLIHRQGCEKLIGSTEKVFLGSLTSTLQIIGAAKNRVKDPRLCYLCFIEEYPNLLSEK